MKKALEGDNEGEDDDAESVVAGTKPENCTEGTKAAGNKTARDEATKKAEESRSNASKKSEDSLSPPRSQSLPNMTWQEDNDLSGDDIFEKEESL